MLLVFRQLSWVGPGTVRVRCLESHHPHSSHRCMPSGLNYNHVHKSTFTVRAGAADEGNAAVDAHAHTERRTLVCKRSSEPTGASTGGRVTRSRPINTLGIRKLVAWTSKSSRFFFTKSL